MAPATILIPDQVHPRAAERLREAGFTVIAPGQLGRAQTVAAIPKARALIVRSATQADEELLRVARQLRFVVRAGAGVDNVDLVEATERGIVVMNTPGANSLAVAEYTIGLMLSLARNIPQAHASLLNGEWKRKQFMGATLIGKTLGLYGFGRIGQAVAARAIAFGMHVQAHDPFLPESVFAVQGVESVSLDALWSTSDFLSLHAEVNEETRGIVNATSLARMKPGVRIVNAARGALVDSSALAAALDQGMVAGIALDVYEQEPPVEDHPLLGRPNVIHTPHLAASAREVQEEVALAAAEILIRALNESQFQNVCNPDVLVRVNE